MKKLLLILSIAFALTLSSCAKPTPATTAEIAANRIAKISTDIRIGVETNIEAVCKIYFIDELENDCIETLNDLDTNSYKSVTFEFTNFIEIPLTEQEKIDEGLNQYDNVVIVTYDVVYNFTFPDDTQDTLESQSQEIFVIINGVYYLAKIH